VRHQIKISSFNYIEPIMPYKNKRNEAVAEQVRTFSQNHVNREKEINDFSTNYEIPSQLESAVMRQPEVHGGSGFAAATVQDLGFPKDATLGATSGEGKPKRKPRKVSIAVGEGLSAAGVSAGGVSGGALLSLRDLPAMHGQPPDTIQAKETLKAEGMSAGGMSAGGGRGKRNDIVREVMKKHGLSLPAASKYVKEHGLY
jgi:hypothetical protein